MRSIWAGAISFGMVVIPVKLYAATEQRDVAFRQVHAEDGGRVQYRRFCSLDGQEVAYSDVAKGYELATGDVVVLTDDDLKELPLATAKRIDALHFGSGGGRPWRRCEYGTACSCSRPCCGRTRCAPPTSSSSTRTSTSGRRS